MSGTDASWPPRLEPTALLDALKVAVIVTDLSGTIVECNRQAEALFQLPRESLVGVRSSSFTPHDLSPDLIAEIAGALTAGETWEGDFTIRRPSGEIVMVHVLDSALLEEVGHRGALLDLNMVGKAAAIVVDEKNLHA